MHVHVGDVVTAVLTPATGSFNPISMLTVCASHILGVLVQLGTSMVM